jgi:Ca2+-binding EF-hand superfamily protein
MGRWLARVDRDRDGTIEREELIADARRQFAAMDLDHDGFVTPSELQEYRAPFAREERDRARRRDAGSGESRGSSDRPDPVMSADRSLRNKVSEADFLAQAERKFRLIDANHDARLDKYELTKACSVEKS